MTLTELEAQMLLKIGEKYQKQDQSFVYGAFAQIKDEAAAFVDLSLQQIRTFFHSRRKRANAMKKRLYSPDAVPQRVPIKMFYGYSSVRDPQRHSAYKVIQAQRQELEEEFNRLRLKEYEVENQERELEDTVKALEKVNKEREKLMAEIEDAQTHIAKLNSAYEKKKKKWSTSKV